MGLLHIWQAREEKAKTVKRTKRILLLVGCILLLLLLIVSFYIWLYDSSKPIVFSPSVNENRIKAIAEQFPANVTAKQTEVSIKQGSLKALLVLSAEQCDAAERLEEVYRREEGVGVQYRKADTTPETEILLRSWTYTPIKAVFTGKGNPYAVCYGKRAAQGKPNYRYMLEVVVQKGGGRYLMRAFCSRPNDLDSLLSAFAEQMVQMADADK